MRKIAFLGALIAAALSAANAFAAATTIPYVANNAALKSLPTTQYKSGVMRLGFTNAGDSNRILFIPSNSPCTLHGGTGDNGSQVPGINGKCWLGIFPIGIYDVTAFGADKTGAVDSVVNIQDAVNAASGGQVYFPAGFYKQCGVVSSTAPVDLKGAGSGAGPGLVLPRTSIRLCGATQGGYHITAGYRSLFAGFNLTSLVPQTAGVGILLDTTTTVVASQSLFYDLSFGNTYTTTNLYNPIQIITPNYPDFRNIYCQGWVLACVSETTVSGTEGSGGYFAHNHFFGDPANTSQGPPIYSEVGYTDVHDNEILAGSIGVQFAIKNHGGGWIKVHDNTIENSRIASIDLTSQDGSTLSNIMFQNNEVSNILYTSAFAGHFMIHEYLVGGVAQKNIFNDIHIEGNSLTSSLPVNAKYMWIETGTGINIANNNVRDIGVANPYAFQITGRTSNAGYSGPIAVNDNGIVGTTNKYALQNVTPVRIRDMINGLTVATIPGSAGAGSQIYLTDGAPGSNPCTGASTGTVAFMLGAGSWKCF